MSSSGFWTDQVPSRSLSAETLLRDIRQRKTPLTSVGHAPQTSRLKKAWQMLHKSLCPTNARKFLSNPRRAPQPYWAPGRKSSDL